MENDRNNQHVSERSRRHLYEQLRSIGISEKVAGDVSADLGDLAEGIAKLQMLFSRIAAGQNVEDALDSIETETRDHLRGHLKSILGTVKALRRHERKRRKADGSGRPPTS